MILGSQKETLENTWACSPNNSNKYTIVMCGWSKEHKSASQRLVLLWNITDVLFLNSYA